MENFYGDDDDLIQNTATRIPVCLCIDTSTSMNRVVTEGYTDTGKTVFKDGMEWHVVNGGETLLSKMESGVNKFYKAVKSNDQARMSCELAIVTFDDTARVVEDFTTIDQKKPFKCSNTGNNTAMSKGVQLALDLLERRKQKYKSQGTDYFQPWLVIFTDGEPSDNIKDIQTEIRGLSNDHKLTVFTFALSEDVNMEVLSGFSKRKPISLKQDKLENFFEWLGKSVSTVSCSQVGESIKLDVSDIDEWAEI